jgi:hypothetical protein
LDHKKVKLLIFEKALDWIARKRSCGVLRSFVLDHKLWKAVESFGLDHKKVKLLIVEKALDWIT